jgi:hypothetical protein
LGKTWTSTLQLAGRAKNTKSASPKEGTFYAFLLFFFLNLFLIDQSFILVYLFQMVLFPYSEVIP